LRHVAQQAGAVVGTDDDVHRVGEHRHRAPADLDDPLRLTATQLQHRGAVLTVNAHAAALGDVADDRVARQGLATAGHLRHQVAHALDLDIAALAGLVAGGLARDQFQLFVAAFRLDQLLGQVDQLRQTQVAGTEGGVHVFGDLHVGLFGQLVEIHLGQAQARQFAFEQGFAGGHVLVARLQFEPMDDLRPRPRRGDVTQVRVQPIAARGAVLAGDDFDLFTGLQAVVERHDTPIDLGAPAVVADFGVHAVGKVQRRGALRQVDGVAVGGEDVDPVRLDVDAQLFRQAADIAEFFVPFQHLAQPGDFLFVLVGPGLDVGALVAPVRAHPQLRLFVHGVSADLHFQHLALGADHRSVQRAVAVFLGVGDVVVELLGDVPPQGVDDAQRGVAVAYFRDQHAHGAHVVDLAEGQALALHFAPDGIDVLGPAADVGVDAGGLQLSPQLAHHVGDETLTVKPPLMQQRGDLFVLVGLEVPEGQVFQFPLDMADTQAMGERRVDIEDLAGHAVALLIVGGLHRTDRAGAFGQLDQGDAHVVDHCHQHLAQVLDLALGAQHHGLARTEAGTDGRHAQHAIDQFGHHGTKTLADGGQRNMPFPHAAIEHGGDQRILVQLEIGENLGDFQAGAKARSAFGPQVLGRIVLLFRLTSELAGCLQGFTVQCRIDTDGMIQPCLEIDTAVGVDRLVCSHLYHLAYLPYDAPSMRQKSSPTCFITKAYTLSLAGHGLGECRPVGLNGHPSPLQITPSPRHARFAETCRGFRHVLAGSPA